ncbi:hypothetical protein SAMN02787108_03224 [Lysinibacillus fusiformis]|nr:hypothetical protein SAMN02787108_03224 [Lysinibacillus fusiformis]SDB46045.1 hypothetical protein SAMN02787070_03419 [Lysinibacillus fusiformis]SFI72152.1 hypothetical protein SAMN02787080_03438 [Lysinibacillus fusiformis]SFT15318.1 hypothetical protein SAMN02787099_03139 [Lysinibacillus fusiformis]
MIMIPSRMIGQSVDGGMFQAIANKIAEVFFLNRKKQKKKENQFYMQLDY